jgi:hypothetical protein
MTFFGRDNRPDFEARFAEQERRRANERAAARPRPRVEDVESARVRTDSQPARARAIRWIRRTLHR